MFLAGSFSTTLAANSSSVCKACPLGTFSNITGSGFMSCEPCPSGSFSASPGSTTCYMCNPGTALKQAEW